MMYFGFGLIADWMCGCHFRTLGDALYWQSVLARRGFRLEALTGGYPDGSYYVSWYIDAASRREIQLKTLYL